MFDTSSVTTRIAYLAIVSDNWNPEVEPASLSLVVVSATAPGARVHSALNCWVVHCWRARAHGSLARYLTLLACIACRRNHKKSCQNA